MERKYFKLNLRHLLILLLVLAAASFAFHALCAVRPQPSYHPSGWSEDGLYINHENNTYLYPKSKAGTGSLTPDKLLDSFTVETQVEGIVWEIYSVKGSPNLSRVLAISGTNSSWTCYAR